jgi:hypothetical protein
LPDTYLVYFTAIDTVTDYQRTCQPETIVVTPPRIEIILPADSAKVTFNALDPGRLDILAVGTTVPDSLRDSLVWSITPIVGSTLASKPTIPKGDSVWFRYTGLPDSNNQFGVKYLKASLVDYDVAESVMVKVFFPKYATNHGLARSIICMRGDIFS